MAIVMKIGVYCVLWVVLCNIRNYPKCKQSLEKLEKNQGCQYFFGTHFSCRLI